MQYFLLIKYYEIKLKIVKYSFCTLTKRLRFAKYLTNVSRNGKFMGLFIIDGLWGVGGPQNKRAHLRRVTFKKKKNLLGDGCGLGQQVARRESEQRC